MAEYDSVIWRDAAGNPLNFTTLTGGNALTPPNGLGTFYSISFTLLTKPDVLTEDYAVGSNTDLDYYALPFPPPQNNPYFDNFTDFSGGQLDAIARITKHSSAPQDLFSVYFGDVAKINFSSEANGAIAIGSNSSANNIFTTDGVARTFIYGDSGISMPMHGDIWFKSDAAFGWTTVTEGNQAFLSILHEFGHALGLKHSDDNVHGISSTATQQYSMMSTTAHPDMADNIWTGGLQLYDIAAIQSIYGRNYGIRNQNTEYKFGTSEAFGINAATPFIYTIWDGGGDHDLINATGYADAVQVDLRQGHFSSIGVNGKGSAVQFDEVVNGQIVDHGNVAIAFHSIIEDATGTSKNDVLIGNAWANKLSGEAGNDYLFGSGIAFDGVEGFTAVANDDPADPNAADGNDTNDPNRSKPASNQDNDILIGGADDDVMIAGYVEMPELLASSDIVSLHCPLTHATHHLIDTKAIAQMKQGVMLINTSRGAVVDAKALIAGLKSDMIGHVGLDVYEEEADLFFENLSDQVIQDDVFSRLLTFPNVLITGHQAFFTREAMTAIAEITIGNISSFEKTGAPTHPVSIERLA